LPAAANIVFSGVCVYLSAHWIDLTRLKAYLGLALILIAVWMAFFFERVRIRAAAGNAVLCGSLSGIANGLFAIGGPPMVVYYLGAYGDDIVRYIGTFQFFLAVTNVFGIAQRFVNGLVTAEILILLLPGIAGVSLGMWVGVKSVAHMKARQVKKLIYVFLAVSGAATFLLNL